MLGALVHAGRHERLVAGAELAIGDVAARTLERELVVPALDVRHVEARVGHEELDVVFAQLGGTRNRRRFALIVHST